MQTKQLKKSVSFLNVRVTVTLKYLSNVLRSLDLPLMNREAELDLSWRKDNILITNDNDITSVNFMIPLHNDYFEYYF